MIILPAIDIQGGRCVRLLQGDFSTAQQVAGDPLEAARRFEQDGAQWLHMVDLDGAREKRPVNDGAVEAAVKNTALHVEVGGGVRDLDTVERYLDMGVRRVILGSAALRSPALVREAVRRFGGGVAVGIDARNGMAAAEGWLETSEVHYLDLARMMEQEGVGTLIFTDIGRDGTLAGVNLDALERLNGAVSCDVIASGGVRDIGDIAALKALGIYGVICGKSLYQGTLSLPDALETAQED